MCRYNKIMIKTIKNEIKDWEYQLFLLNASGTSTVNLYNDLKILVNDLGDNDDYVSNEFIERMSTNRNQPDFVGQRLLEKAKQYKYKKL